MNARSKLWILPLLATLAACGAPEARRASRAVETSAASATFFLSDAQGTPVALADASGAIVEQRSHHALGASRNASPSIDGYDFVSNELDPAVGISDFSARP